jgi:tetratricopeptide (TPR) repeat protein
MEEQPPNGVQEHTSEVSRDAKSEAQARVEEGRLFYRQGKFGEALSYLYVAYERYSEDGDQSRTAEVANDMGVVCTVLQRWDEAGKWLNEAHDWFTKISDYSGEAQALGNLGSMFRARGDLKQAAANFQLAADRFHLVGDDQRRAATLRALTIVRLSQFRFFQALAAYDAALACESDPTFFQRLLRRIISAPLRMIRG